MNCVQVHAIAASMPIVMCRTTIRFAFASQAIRAILSSVVSNWRAKRTMNALTIRLATTMNASTRAPYPIHAP